MAGKGRGGRNGGKKKGGRKQSAVRRIKGRGNYQVSTSGAQRTGLLAKLDKVLARIPRGTFANAGAALGAKYGGGFGSRVGRMAGAGVSAITGYGNYNVVANSVSRTATSMDMVPQFTKGEHSVRVRHREFIKDIIVPEDPADFNLESYLINPANKDLFPWLGQMSRQYQQYRIHGMVLVFKSMSSDYAAAGPLGTVMIATNYNAVDREYTSKVELENSEFAVSCKPSMNLVHAIECDPKVTGLETLYIRDPAYETGETSDRRFYDYGKVQFATQGLPGTPGNTMGELWITYDIELMKPIIGGVFSPGKTVLSTATGDFLVSETSGTQRIKYTGTPIAPAASTAYTPLPATYTMSQITALQGTVLDLQGAGANLGITFKKNGNYRIWFSSLNQTTSSAFTLAGTPTSITATVTRYGNAQYNGSTATVPPAPTASYGANIVPYSTIAGGQATNPTGLSYMMSFEVNVTGINAATDYVLFTPSTFTSASGTDRIALWSRDVLVEWTAFGINDQLALYRAI